MDLVSILHILLKKEVGVYLTASVLQIVATNLVQKFAEAKIFYHDLDQKEC